MRYIPVPQAITLTDPVTGDTGQMITFNQFVFHTLLNDAAFGNGYDSLKVGASIRKAVNESRETGTVKLDENDWENLVNVIKYPRNGFVGLMPVAVAQLLPFMDAIIEAQRG